MDIASNSEMPKVFGAHATSATEVAEFERVDRYACKQVHVGFTVENLSFGPCADLGGLRDVMHAAFARYNDDPIPSSALAETAESLAADVSKGWLLFEVRLNGELVATAKAFAKREKLYFGRLAVLPELQGQGIGKFLVLSLATEAQRRGVEVLECKVRQSEAGNIEMYRSLGFALVSQEVTVSTTGQHIPTVTMHRSVS